MLFLPGRDPFVRRRARRRRTGNGPDFPPIFAWNDRGSTPEPESRTARRIGRPIVTLRSRSRIDGGDVSLTQKRNVKAPGLRVGRRVEHELIGARIGQYGSHDRLGNVESLIRVHARRNPGVADDAVLVLAGDEARRDAHAGGVTHDGNAEVPDRSP